MVSSSFDIRCIPAPSQGSLPAPSSYLCFLPEAGGLHTCPGNEQDAHLLAQMGGVGFCLSVGGELPFYDLHRKVQARGEKTDPLKTFPGSPLLPCKYCKVIILQLKILHNFFFKADLRSREKKLTWGICPFSQWMSQEERREVVRSQPLH